MLNCFCSMIDKQKVFSLTSSWNRCQRYSLLLISNMLGTGLELVQNLSSGLVEQSCAVVITSTPRHRTGTGTCTYFDIKLQKKKWWTYPHQQILQSFPKHITVDPFIDQYQKNTYFFQSKCLPHTQRILWI